MKAVCWQSRQKIAVENVPDPRVLDSRDAIVRVTSTAICGSDLDLYEGAVPSLAPGDILGHEFMGEVVEKGPDVASLDIGDRVVVPCAIACGCCAPCREGRWALCDKSNRNAWLVERLYGTAGAGLFGCSELYGGYAGGQAEYVRVPYADVGPLRVPATLSDDAVLFLSDILPAAFTAAERCAIEEGDTVAVFGCGAVGLLTIQSAFLLGAARVIAIDRLSHRLELARARCGAETLNVDRGDVFDAIRTMTGGRGADACIDTAGLEAHGCESSGGCVQGDLVEPAPSVPLGSGPTLRTGRTHVHRYMRPLLALIEHGVFDPSFVASHHVPLDDAPSAYQMFRNCTDGCTKVVMHP
ncbi:MAG TPA: alcohol dehydrogenase catalytic domain-containing protein [Vicinamibacterales bacterium]|nr:alcohol dehydrogenase catalytic domain-containing protein [Vicinamibacterales bacterium]